MEIGDNTNIQKQIQKQIQKTKQKSPTFNQINKLKNSIDRDYNKNYRAYYNYINKTACGFNGDELVSRFPEKIIICKKIETVSDLIDLINEYPFIPNVKYNIDLQTLHAIKDDLIKLDSMIGMKSLKRNIVNQILYYIQNLHNFESESGDFMHIVLYGPPGTGKTEIAKIIGSIFSKMKILPAQSFKKATRADLVAGFLGQTALKTRDLIKKSLGGVLFIDEAYSLGNSEKIDSFAKECIDILCEALSDHKDNLMVIIAGYEDELKKCFFNYNSGLESRFIWRYKTDEYTAEELMKIFIKKVKEASWYMDERIKLIWFENNYDKFKYYGRSMESLFTKAKIAHSRRIFSRDETEFLRKNIIEEDLDEGVKLLDCEKKDDNIQHYLMYN
jgi:SpoVK/Ycf46/Vps4 family AAA+-type ATPase